MMGAGLLGFEEAKQDLAGCCEYFPIPERGVLRLRVGLAIEPKNWWAGVITEVSVSDESELEFKVLKESDPHAMDWPSDAPRGKKVWVHEIRANYKGRINSYESGKETLSRLLTEGERQLMQFLAQRVAESEEGYMRSRIKELEAALQAKPSVDDIALAVIEKFGRHFQEAVEHRAPSVSSPADDTRAAVEAENRKKLDRRLNYPW